MRKHLDLTPENPNLGRRNGYFHREVKIQGPVLKWDLPTLPEKVEPLSNLRKKTGRWTFCW
jgi:hypothetical protein